MADKTALEAVLAAPLAKLRPPGAPPSHPPVILRSTATVDQALRVRCYQ